MPAPPMTTLKGEQMLLEPMTARLHKQPDLKSALNCVLKDTVALLGGEFGDIQLRRDDGVLVLVDHKFLPISFLESLGHVTPDDQTVCARAARENRTVVVSNVEEDELFKRFLSFARTANFQAVLSTPIVSTAGDCVGVVSVHFANRYSPSLVEISTLEEYCQRAADYLLEKVSLAKLAETAEELYGQMILRESKRASVPIGADVS